MYVKHQTEELCIEAIKGDGEAIKYVKDQTEAICLEAVKENGKAIRFIYNKSNPIYFEAVKDMRSLKYIKDQIRKIPECVKYNGLALKYIEDQTETICLDAVKDFGLALEYVKHQTEVICIEAVKQDGRALQYVKDKTDEIYKEALNNNIKDSLSFVVVKCKSTAMIVLKSLADNKLIDEIILTKILNKFSKDEEVLNFYTKHNFWKYVNFNRLRNHKLFQYGMSL